MRIDINAIRCFFSCGTCTVSSWSRFSPLAPLASLPGFPPGVLRRHASHPFCDGVLILSVQPSWSPFPAVLPPPPQTFAPRRLGLLPLQHHALQVFHGGGESPLRAPLLAAWPARRMLSH